MILRRHHLSSVLAAAIVLGSAAGAPQAAHAAPSSPTVQQGYAGPKLDAAQQTKANARRARMKSDLQALNVNKTMTPAQKQAKFMKMKSAYEADMLQILTPAQRRDFLANQAKMRVVMAQRQAAFQARLVEMQKIGKALNASITPDQKAKLKTLKASTNARAKAIYDDKSLAPPAKKARLDALEKEYETKATTIMTPAQQKQFQRFQEIQAEQVK